MATSPIHDGRHFRVLSGPFTSTADDSTEVCGVRLLGNPDLNLINIYRPPIRPDERTDHFSPDSLPDGERTILAGDINAHHPLWHSGCEEANEVGERMAEWLDRGGWSILNGCRRNFTSYRSDGQTAPDVAICSPSMSRRCTWTIGPDLGSDHLPMLLRIRTVSAPPDTFANRAGHSRRPPGWRSKMSARLPSSRRGRHTSLRGTGHQVP